MPADLANLSVRAQSWIGAQCLRHYCARRCVEDERIWAFCRYIEELASTSDLPAWEARGGRLEVSGLGDPLPPNLEADRDLVLIVQNVHEISASQIYGAWVPSQAASFLRAAAALAGYQLADMRSAEVFEKHEPGRDGWGQPIDEATSESWREAAQLRGERAEHLK